MSNAVKLLAIISRSEFLLLNLGSLMHAWKVVGIVTKADLLKMLL
jgi:hypothetical protein